MDIDKILPKYVPTPMSATKQGRHIVHRAGRKEYQVPRLPYVRAVDGDGHLVALVISTNRDPAEQDRIYGALAVQRLERNGGFLWDKVPHGSTPEKWAVERVAKQAALQASYAKRHEEDPEKPSEAKVEEAKAEIREKAVIRK